MAALSGYRIYMVDPCEPVRQSIEFGAESHGLEFHGFSDPITFLNNAHLDINYILISERNLFAKMDGIGLIRHLNETGKLCLAVILTGCGDVPQAVNALKAGAADFFSKPVTMDWLVSRFQQLVDQRLGG